MCTIFVAKDVFAGFPLVVAANRDELLDRPSEPPSISERMRQNNPSEKIKILAPRDLVRGGMWVGTNENGVLIGLTNRLNVKSVKGRMSRGKIVSDALESRTAMEAFESISKLSGDFFNGFYLVAADASNLYTIDGDGIRIHTCQETNPGFVVISNHGIGREITSDTPRRVINTLTAAEDIDNKEPIPENLQVILDVHSECRYGTCINEPENNYGTKSSSIIRLNAVNQQWDYWHRERNGSQHICNEVFQPRRVLKIIGSC